MVEYIDREKLKTQLTMESSLGHIKTLEDVERIVDFVSTADVAPVKHGKWIHNDEWWEFICTSCYRGIGNIKKYKYCPYCGAKMDLE